MLFMLMILSMLRLNYLNKRVLKKLHQLFEIGKPAVASFKYIGLNVLDDGNQIEVLTLAQYLKKENLRKTISYFL